MNSKYLIGIVVIIVVVLGGVFYFMDTNKTSQVTPPVTTQEQNQPEPTQAASPESQNTIMIQNFAYSPASLTVKVGDKVTWTNQDSAAHSATADDKSFDTGLLPQGQSGSVTFSKAGTYTYHCSAHPNMKATIIVE